ncbi:ATP-binding protein, partial [Bdellovibrionota bacterium FG-2]
LLIAEGEGLAVEFKEKYTPKISQDICGFANSMGGKIILGVADDGTVKGEKLTGAMKAEIFSLGRNCDPPIEVKVAQTGQVVVVTVPVGDDKPHASGGSYYKRFDAVTQKLNRNEIKAVFEANAHFHFDEKVDPRATLEDISLDKVRAFIKETGKSLSVTKKTLPLLFESLKLTRNGRITNAGIMMFAKDPGKFLMHCQTHMAAFKGTERVNIYDKKYVRNDLLTQFNEAVAFCEKHLNERAEIRGVNRYDIYEIPMEAIREAIVNAIVHRDYSMGGTNVMVEVHADRVEISNPGGLPPGFSTAMLGKKSFRRNEVIADLFHRMDKSERMGSGIERIRRTLKSAGVKAPKFESDLFFTIVFERP